MNRGMINNSEKMVQKSRNSTLDVIRGVAILIVVIGHAIQINLAIPEQNFIWSTLILAFQMPLLFFLADIQQDFHI